VPRLVELELLVEIGVVHIWKDGHTPAQQRLFAVLVVDGVSWESLVHVVVSVEREADLLEIVLALAAGGGFANFINSPLVLGDVVLANLFLARLGTDEREHDLPAFLVGDEFGWADHAGFGCADRDLVIAIELVDADGDVLSAHAE